MDPTDVLALIGVLGLAGMALGALKMILSYRAARLGGGADPKALEHLADAVDHLRDQLEQHRAEIVELQERVDFAERVLAKGREELPPGKPVR